MNAQCTPTASTTTKEEHEKQANEWLKRVAYYANNQSMKLEDRMSSLDGAMVWAKHHTESAAKL